MRVSSYIRESFLEYGDYIALVLFSHGCNMKCDYCYNYSQITDVNSILKQDVYSIIDSNITDLTDALVFLGGEPTIYGRELFKISKYAKQKYNLMVKIFSNATNPNLLLEGLTRGHFDKVSVDFKAYFPTHHIKYDRNWLAYVDGMICFLKQVNAMCLLDRVEVRMTVVDDLTKDFDIIKKICSNMGVSFLRQEDVKASYQELGLVCMAS